MVTRQQRGFSILLLLETLGSLFLFWADALQPEGINASPSQPYMHDNLDQEFSLKLSRHTIEALAGSGLEVVITVPNDQIQNLSRSKSFSIQWVKKNVANVLPNVNIVGVIVGMEVLTKEDHLLPFLVPAMKSIYIALLEAKLADSVKVSTMISFSTLAYHLASPSTAERKKRNEMLEALRDFLSETGSSIMLSFPYKQEAEGRTDVESAVDQRVSSILNADKVSCRKATNGSNVSRSEMLFQVNNSRKMGILIDSRIFKGQDDLFDCSWSYSNAYWMRPYELDAFRRRVLLQNSTAPNLTWCVANSGVDDSSLQAALDYACGQGGADCKPIKFGKPCFEPNTVRNHASYVFNSYYQRNAKVGGSCSFSGAATVTTVDPSHGSCKFPTSASLNQTTVIAQESSATGQGIRLHSILLLLFLYILVNIFLTFTIRFFHESDAI